MLAIKDLYTSVEDKKILEGLTLSVKAGEVHALMGPNGSGKSTLANILAGKDGYQVTQGSVLYEDKNLLELSPEERARKGVFLAFQYPVEIPGVNNIYLLKAGLNAIRPQKGSPKLDALEYMDRVQDKMKRLKTMLEFLSRSVNSGLSGGAETRNEV